MIRSGNLAVPLFALALLIVWAGQSSAQEDAIHDHWDQARATQLAEQISKQVGLVRVTLKKAAPGTAGRTRKQQYRLEEDLRLIRNSSRHLAKQLESGKSRDETLPTARRVGMFVRDARVSAAGWTPPAWIKEKLDPARDSLAELAELYGVTLQEVYRNTPSVAAPPKD
ncbi:MAG: hypothetical protein VX614_04840 [Myxococcota bacterium]|nr:hypothetical protein [Myxococcota bacterium]